MKRIVSCLAAALLCVLLAAPTLCRAESCFTVTELAAQAESGWHQTYEAHGRTIPVDIDIHVPAVSSLPVQSLCFGLSSLPAASQPTDLLIGGRPEDNIVWINTEYFPEPVSDKVDKLPSEVFANPKELDRAYAPDSELTLGGALSLVKGALTAYGYQPEDFTLDAPYRLSTFRYVDSKTKQAASPGEYYLYFHQQLGGVPIYTHIGMAFAKRDKSYYNPSMIANIVSDEAISLFVERLEPDGQLAPDVPLLALDAVIASVEKEIDAGHIRKVFALDLGYVLYDNPEYATPDRYARHYYALPAWRLNCLWVDNAKDELGWQEGGDVFECDTTEYATIVISAQTGEMVDYKSGEKDRAAYAGFVTWDDVGGAK